MDIDQLEANVVAALRRGAPGLARLGKNEDALARVLKEFQQQDAAGARHLLDRLRIGKYCQLICSWITVWHCQRICRLVCQEPLDRDLKPDELRELGQNLARLAKNEDLSKQLVEAFAREDVRTIEGILKEFKLLQFCHFICYWICYRRFGIFCTLVCPRPPDPGPDDLVTEFRDAAAAFAKLTEDPDLFAEALEAYQAKDIGRLREILEKLDLQPLCIIICRWLCIFHCWRICRRLCRVPKRAFSVAEARNLLLRWRKLAAREEDLDRLVEAVEQGDEKSFAMVLERYGLSRYCYFICQWICLIRCWLLCRILCPPELECEIEDPEGCTPEEVSEDLRALVVPVRGTASGGGFDHYTLEWSTDNATWHSTDFHYPPIPPGGGTQGNSPVVNGLLAYFDTTALDAGPCFLRLTVHSKQGVVKVCKGQFTLFKQDVRILGVDGFTNLDKPAFDPAARFVELVTPKCSSTGSIQEVSFARCLSIEGSAFVGGCDEKKIKRYTIDYKPGHETDCGSPGWTNAWKVEFGTPWQYRDMNMRQDTSRLTARWVTDCVVPVPFPPYCLLNVPDARLSPSCWQTQTSNCLLSGLFTLRLEVTDVDGNRYCDLQRVWIDNKPIHAKIQIDAIPPCRDLKLSDFALPPDCSNPWALPLSGLAYDEYIDETLPLTPPNDNFDYYWIKVSKQGGPEVQIPIDAPAGSCFHGTKRVGEAGPRCQAPAAAEILGKLADFDLRTIDKACAAAASYAVPPGFSLNRGECCVYSFRLRVFDRTKFSGGPHRGEAFWPVKICNDLKP